MSKKRYGFFLSEEEINYLKRYKEDNKLHSQNVALAKIIKEHKEFNSGKREKEIDKISDGISKKVIKNIKELIKGDI